MLKKVFIGLTVLTLAIVLGFVGYVRWQLQPWPEPRSLPANLVAATAPQGKALLDTAVDAADYAPLASHFVAQQLKSYCGVASSVAVLSALGEETTQSDFFTGPATAVRSRLDVTLGGMTLADLSGLLAAHGVEVSTHYADAFSVDDFRDAIERNLSWPGDYLVVNYQRAALGQSRGGHISPLAAYNREQDMVLVMDTASHYYPQTWVPVAKLFDGMQAVDPSSGRSRGYVEVSRVP